ncbi:unnamed protein product, partial [Laminaria digitata]
ADSARGTEFNRSKTVFGLASVWPQQRVCNECHRGIGVLRDVKTAAPFLLWGVSFYFFPSPTRKTRIFCFVSGTSLITPAELHSRFVDKLLGLAVASFLRW